MEIWNSDNNNLKVLNYHEFFIQPSEEPYSDLIQQFGEVFKMAEQFGQMADCTIIGVEPKSIEFGQKLSDEVKQSLPSIINMVIEEAKKYGN